MKKLVASLIMFAGLSGLFCYNPVQAAENITVKGSDTMVIL